MPTVTASLSRHKSIFFVPKSALASCKAAGTGRYPGAGKYTECCWTAMGTGQFRPGDTANPLHWKRGCGGRGAGSEGGDAVSWIGWC